MTIFNCKLKLNRDGNDPKKAEVRILVLEQVVKPRKC